MFLPHPAAYSKIFYASAKYTKASDISSCDFLLILSLAVLLRWVIFYTKSSEILWRGTFVTDQLVHLLVGELDGLPELLYQSLLFLLTPLFLWNKLCVH